MYTRICASLLIGSSPPPQVFLEIRLEINSNYLLFKKREVLHRDKLVAYWRNSRIEKLSVFADVSPSNS